MADILQMHLCAHVRDPITMLSVLSSHLMLAGAPVHRECNRVRVGERCRCSGWLFASSDERRSLTEDTTLTLSLVTNLQMTLISANVVMARVVTRTTRPILPVYLGVIRYGG